MIVTYQASPALLPLPSQHFPAAPPRHEDRPPKRDRSTSRKAVMRLICNTPKSRRKGCFSCRGFVLESSPSNENKISYGRAGVWFVAAASKEIIWLRFPPILGTSLSSFEVIQMMPKGEAPVYLRGSKSPPIHPARWLPSRGREMRAHRSAFPSSDSRTSGQCQNRPNRR